MGNFKNLIMKKLSAIFIALLISVMGFSQSWTESIEGSGGIPPLQNVNGLNNAAFESLTGNPGEFSKIMGVLGEFDDITLGQKGIQGSVMFFDKENKGKLYVNNGKIYTIDNINYNIKTNQFQSRMKNDSIFIYKMDGLKRVVINNTDFSIMYNPVEKREKIYEVIEPGVRISLVKDHIIKHQQASPNPMVNRSSSKFIKKWKYYTVDNQNKIEPFKAKKKFLLGMIQDEGKRKKLKDYLSENKLSTKKDEDLKKIFKYLNAL
jgi:hypothetical protein